MMAQSVPHQSTDKKRVKVYELRNNDWFDRGTGFCTAVFSQTEDGQPRDPRVVVESEDPPHRLLLETKICKEDGFQKQQETLIVWTEPSNGIDMALSFQEADGCALIWKFVNTVQQSFHNGLAVADDSLSDDLGMDMPTTVTLPPAKLENLAEIEANMRIMSSTTNGRDALAKCIMGDDYIGKLIPLVELAEEFESLPDLHRLCNIMKTVILLNDTSIIEHAVSDDCVFGVVHALEYDPDFPSHKANHRVWLEKQGRYKEVVPIEDDQIRRKIHQTYRLQYLKDVVLARILDDPTFSVLNSLIFFNQVDIVQHLQGNAGFLNDLFTIFKTTQPDQKRKKDAVLFIQQCCAIAKNLQPPARQSLYNNFLSHGLLQVINFGLRHTDVGVRVGATDILVSMIDHDAQMIRQTIFRQIKDAQSPLTDSLIDLLLVEVDLGVKSQISDALRVLLDPSQPPEAYAKANGDYAAARARQPPSADQDTVLAHFYQHAADRLFKPLVALEGRTEMKFPVQQASMFTYLIDILCFFIRHHGYRSKYFFLERDIGQRVAQLLACPERYLRLVAVRFFRHLIGLGDEFYINHIIEKKILTSILQVLTDTMPRDNLLSSACLEFFEFVQKENIKDMARFLVKHHKETLISLSYIDTFRNLLFRYGQAPPSAGTMEFHMDTEDEGGRRPPANAQSRMMEHIAVDPSEEEYWSTLDDDDGPESQALDVPAVTTNGSTPASKPLVDYLSDEEVDENADPEVLPTTTASSATAVTTMTAGDDSSAANVSRDEIATTTEVPDAASKAASASNAATPPERLSEKRRREEEEDDELGKMMQQNKRRNSSSASSNASAAAAATGNSALMRRKKSFAERSNPAATTTTTPKKIAISISPSVRTGAGSRSEEDS